VIQTGILTVKRFTLKRQAAFGTLAATAFSAVMLAAPAANAAATGSLSFAPTSGNDTTLMTVTTSAACTGGTNLQVYLSGGNFTALTSISPNSPQSNYATAANGGLIIPISNDLAQLATSNGVQLAVGTYTFDAICKNAFGATTFGDYQGQINITQITPTVAWAAVSNATATTTTLASSVASPITAGTPVTFTATINPAAAGTVQFNDNGTALGAPVTVATGTAAFTASALGAGNHSITAVFTSTDPNFAGSTSTAMPFVVNAGQQATTTGLAVSPSGVAGQGALVTLSATVNPGTAAGSVQFSDNGAALGTPATITNGVATLTTSTLALGAHSFTAAFTATNSAAFGNSVSAAIPYQISATPPPTASESISTTVVPGALVISVPDNQVTLPSPVLDNAGDMFNTSGALKPVTVTDNRSGNPGWTVNGQVSNFSDGNAHGISGENLGWTPNVVDHSGGQTITQGGVIAPAAGVAVNDPGTNGLKGSHALAIASAGAGLGTAHLAAGLALNVPTTTVAGTYVATLTLTAI
jgi:hypothetical protein